MRRGISLSRASHHARQHVLVPALYHAQANVERVVQDIRSGPHLLICLVPGWTALLCGSNGPSTKATCKGTLQLLQRGIVSSPPRQPISQCSHRIMHKPSMRVKIKRSAYLFISLFPEWTALLGGSGGTSAEAICKGTPQLLQRGNVSSTSSQRISRRSYCIMHMALLRVEIE